MDKTAIVMSREEALALPVKQRPLCYRLGSSIYHRVWEHIGLATQCYEPKPDQTTFKPESASEVAVALLFEIANEVETAKADAFREAHNMCLEAAKNSISAQGLAGQMLAQSKKWVG